MCLLLCRLTEFLFSFLSQVHLVPVALPGTDGDPHSGYDLCAPKRQGKHKHWVPRYMHICRCLQVEGRLRKETKQLQKQIKKTTLSSGFRGRAGTIAGLLWDWAMLTINRSWGPAGAVQRVIQGDDVITILKVLALEDLDEEDYDPCDGTPRPPGHLDPSVGAKGLGTAGEVRVPPGILKKYAPAGLGWVLANLPDQGETKDAGLEALATRMCEDGLDPRPAGRTVHF